MLEPEGAAMSEKLALKRQLLKVEKVIGDFAPMLR